jgi:hypothetical protein
MNEHITTEKLSEYIDGFSESGEKSRIESHLSFCAQCRNELESLQRMIAHIGDMKNIVIANTEQFISSTMAKIRRRRKIKLFRHAMMPVAAAAVVLFIVGFGLFEDHQQSAALKTASHTMSQDAKDLAAVDYEDVVGTSASSRSIIATLQNNHAMVTKQTDDYIEATVSLEDYQKIRSSFGFTHLPAGFVGNGLDLASVGDDARTSAPSYGQDQVKIRIRRR